LALLVLAVLVGPLVWLLAARPFVEGDAICIACGRSARRLPCFGIELWSGPAALGGVTDAVADRYASFTEVGEHAHDWIPVGCRRLGLNGIGCTMLSGAAWFEELPDVEDRALARALAARAREAPVAERRELLRSFDLRANAGLLGESRFDAWHEAWLRTHPDWP